MGWCIANLNYRNASRRKRVFDRACPPATRMPYSPMVYLLTFISAMSSIVGNVLGKVWADREEPRWLVWMFVSFAISSLAYAYSLRYGKYTIVNAMFYAIVPVITVVSGIYLFKEKLTALQTAGLLLGVISIVLLTVEGRVAR